MGLRINTNIPALNAQRQTRRTSNDLLANLEKLSAGLRINRAADDAAGLAIAERLRTRVRQYTQEASNLQYGVNAIQTAEGGMAEQQSGLQRLRELATQAANGTLSDEQRAALNAEAQQIVEQIGAIADQTEFNGLNLLNGTAGTIELGTEGGNEITINESTVTALGLGGIDLTTQAGATNALADIDAAVNRVSQNRANLGAQENRLNRAIEQREIGIVNEQAAESRIRDLDYAREVVQQTRNQILLEGGVAVLVQANMLPQTAARLLGG
ncbi:MAG TPA: flagellin FliC [Candidatus Hydrogenedentes bacterium]|nr:flagellin FliC [Candidatus Hydrogenedentota bacterium]HIJ72658.1 flagellin FliC [Candidatus Hydrogenedentota bacterium]